ncbi:MAG: NAD(P)H-dependent oxidoreductase [Sphingosinicella sp.]|nr:NAD(P)H-dependent oxidoreductase [Sphingosinicella sp.]
MTNALIINSSVQADASVSSKLTRQLADRLKAADPNLEINIRDIGANPLPHLTPETVGAIRGADPETNAARASLALSDTLVDELRRADLLVIGSPMYNFGMASTLKAWFDHVLRAGFTFRYNEDGPEGLMKGKKAVVVVSRAGFYSEGAGSAQDSQEPHLWTLLAFMGITDVIFVRVEKLAFGPDAAAAAIEAAAQQLAALTETELALAA